MLKKRATRKQAEHDCAVSSQQSHRADDNSTIHRILNRFLPTNLPAHRNQNLNDGLVAHAYIARILR